MQKAIIHPCQIIQPSDIPIMNPENAIAVNAIRNGELFSSVALPTVNISCINPPLKIISTFL